MKRGTGTLVNTWSTTSKKRNSTLANTRYKSKEEQTNCNTSGTTNQRRTLQTLGAQVKRGVGTL